MVSFPVSEGAAGRGETEGPGWHISRHREAPLGKREEEAALDWILTILASGVSANQNVEMLLEPPPLPQGNLWWREKFGSFRAGAGSPRDPPRHSGGGSFEGASMAGTVVLDDVELREAQRDYLDFLDDEVRGAPGRETLALGVLGDADGPREAMRDAAPRREQLGGEREDRRGSAQEPSTSILSLFRRGSRSSVAFCTRGPVTFSQVLTMAGAREGRQLSFKYT